MSDDFSFRPNDLQRRTSLCQKAPFFFYFLVNNFKNSLALFFLAGILFNSCSNKATETNQIPPKLLVSCHLPSSPITAPSQHWLYRLIPRERASIRWYEVGKWPLWMLFGNDDDGIFGERSGMPAYENRSASVGTAIRWWLRNPLHNFCFYVIGTADQANSRRILCQWSRREKRVLEPNPCFLVALHGGKPFICIRWPYNAKRKGELYIGWRERGNFGIKCQIYGKRPLAQPSDFQETTINPPVEAPASFRRRDMSSRGKLLIWPLGPKDLHAL